MVRDLFIGVTQFFRDPEAWQALRAEVIRKLVAQVAQGTPVRVWVPACATGEEAYGLGMLVLEELAAAKKSCPMQVFATDVSREALAVARTGIYPESVSADVPPALAARYLTADSHHYRVRGVLRDAVVFAEHNVLADPAVFAAGLGQLPQSNDLSGAPRPTAGAQAVPLRLG